MRLIAIIILASMVVSCSTNGNGNKTALPESPGVTIHADSITIDGDTGDFRVERSVREETEGVQLVTFTFTADRPSELQPVTIRFDFPSVDINGFWNPAISVDRVNYYRSGFSSKATSNAPVITFYNNALKNRLCISLSDALNRADFSSYLKEEDVRFYPSIRLFRERMPLTTSYSITLRIDNRDIPWYEAVGDVADWWAGMPGYEPMNVPDGARQPVYSTWYSYHQNVSTDAIVNECRIASTLGCGTLIVDDGWQTTDSNRGYAFTGDWQPVRMPDMEAFVDSVHATGMKVLLWYSLPFIGENADNYSQFKGKYLTYWESQGTYVLDPRYPEVREFIIGTYEKAIKDWGLDGFKLDFIGRFVPNSETELTKDNGRDFASVYEAVDALMTEVTGRLTAINPDILLEFRQPYIGPLMRKYGNMFRGVDCPNNAVANRIETTNLRVMAGNTAVHSDMFIWRTEEPVEKAALQILNILYSVPQLSVKLSEIPADQIGMIQFWFGFWNDNRDVLINGEFIPSDPTANYPVLTAKLNDRQITTLYQDVVASADKFGSLHIVNAKGTDKVVVDLSAGFKGKVTIRDCIGKITKSYNTSLKNGLHSFSVPLSGMVTLE